MHIYCTARATGKDWAIRVFFLPDGQRYPRPFRGHDASFRFSSLGRAARMRARFELGVRPDMPVRIVAL